MRKIKPSISSSSSSEEASTSTTSLTVSSEGARNQPTRNPSVEIDIEGDAAGNPQVEIDIEGVAARNPQVEIDIEGAAARNPSVEIDIEGDASQPTQNPPLVIDVEGAAARNPSLVIDIESDDAPSRAENVPATSGNANVAVAPENASGAALPAAEVGPIVEPQGEACGFERAETNEEQIPTFFTKLSRASDVDVGVIDTISRGVLDQVEIVDEAESKKVRFYQRDATTSGEVWVASDGKPSPKPTGAIPKSTEKARKSKRKKEKPETESESSGSSSPILLNYFMPAKRIFRSNHRCVLCPNHAIILQQQNVAMANVAARNRALDSLASVDLLSTPSSPRSTDVFKAPAGFVQSVLNPSQGESSTSKPPPRSKSAPTSVWSPPRTPPANLSPQRDVERGVEAADPVTRSLITRVIDRCCCGLGLKLRCMESARGPESYCLLENPVSDKDASTEKDEDIKFFDDIGQYVSIGVEKNLRALDLTHLLARRTHVPKDSTWSIIEHWSEIGAERVLEDHEDVMSVYKRTEGAKKFIFRRYPHRYDFFTIPESGGQSVSQHNTGSFERSIMKNAKIVPFINMAGSSTHIPLYFPPEVLRFKERYARGALYPYSNPEELKEEGYESEFEKILMTEEVLPQVFNQVYLRRTCPKTRWDRVFVLLKGTEIYVSVKVPVVAKFLRDWRVKTISYYKHSEEELAKHDGLEPYLDKKEGSAEDLMEVLADLKEHEVYTCLNGRNQLAGPTPFVIVLRKTSDDTFSNPICLAFDSGLERVCWVTAMRLAKYGKQLRESYKAFKNKQCQPPPPPVPTASAVVVDEKENSRVAMDFTGEVGRIVEDPEEARKIADAEGKDWTNRLAVQAQSAKKLLEAGESDKSHYGQPWYHRNLEREQAANLLKALAKHDGVFVVRGSWSQKGTNVLTLRHEGKILHFPILLISDTEEQISCYTLDNGTTRFFDICQLVEFYRLNAGSLPTRLTNHLEKHPPLRSPSAANPEPL